MFEQFNGDTEFLYHGTSLTNAKSIMDNGFTEETYWGDRDTAESYATSHRRPVLIKIPYHELSHLIEPNTTLIDYYEENIDEDEDYEDIIRKWEESDKTPKDSLDIIGSVILPPCCLYVSEDNIVGPDNISEKLLQKELRERNLLYHSTSFENLLEILETDTLKGSYHDDGISTSRDKDYLFHSTEDGMIKRGRGECQLVLDRDRLKQRYRIRAYDYEEFKSYGDPDFNQAEDKILTDRIPHISKYITGIHLNRNVRSNYRKLMTEFYDLLKNNGITIFGKNWEVLKQF